MNYDELRLIAITKRLRPGDKVKVGGVGRCEVIDNDDPALLTLVTPSGARLRIGRLALHSGDEVVH